MKKVLLFAGIIAGLTCIPAISVPSIEVKGRGENPDIIKTIPVEIEGTADAMLRKLVDLLKVSYYALHISVHKPDGTVASDPIALENNWRAITESPDQYTLTFDYWNPIERFGGMPDLGAQLADALAKRSVKLFDASMTDKSLTYVLDTLSNYRLKPLAYALSYTPHDGPERGSHYVSRGTPVAWVRELPTNLRTLNNPNADLIATAIENALTNREKPAINLAINKNKAHDEIAAGILQLVDAINADPAIKAKLAEEAAPAAGAAAAAAEPPAEPKPLLF